MLVLMLFPASRALWFPGGCCYNRSSGLLRQHGSQDMARVSQSAEIAFRARFEGVPPHLPPNAIGGAGLGRFDGRVWRQIGP